MKLLYALFFLPLGLRAQESPTLNPDPTKAFTKPTIQRIEFPHDVNRRVKPVNTSHEHFIKFDDDPTEPILLRRDGVKPAKLHIKGRGSINTVQVFPLDSLPHEYPLQEGTFRGVNYQEMPLESLPEGAYRIRIISPHRTEEYQLEIERIGAN